jgi:hypothetical protein
MPGRLVTLVLLVGIVFSVLALVPRVNNLRLPGNQQGYEPQQPIAFSHRLHAGELGISCIYCHAGADRSRHAGIPATSVCMNCHTQITGPLGAEETSPELKKLYDFQGLDETAKRDPKKTPRPIPWVKVHNLPDHACFDHRVHINAGVNCQHCHGPVETMERVRQVEDLSMGWCVNCHREVNRKGLAGKKVHASTDCSACHY